MGITAVQKERRMKHLGSSDMAAVLGLSPHQTAYDVWAVKTGRMPEIEANAAMELGNILEPSVIDHAETLYGNLIRNQYRSVKGEGVPIGANVDALIVQSGEPIEAKTVGILNRSNEHWGEPLSDEVPDRVIVQATVHMLCTEQELCYVHALIAGRGFVPYVVRRDDVVVDVIKETAVKFWNEFVLTDTPPANSLPTAVTIQKMRRTPDLVVPVRAVLVNRWQRLSSIKGKIEKKHKAAQIELLAAIGDAEAGECELGLVTYLEQERKEYTVAASKYRVARFKKNKQYDASAVVSEMELAGNPK